MGKTGACLGGGVLLAVGVALALTSVRVGARDVTAALTTDPMETHPYD